MCIKKYGYLYKYYIKIQRDREKVKEARIHADRTKQNKAIREYPSVFEDVKIGA